MGDDHSKRDDEAPKVLSTTSARQGVEGHNVRYVLLWGLVGVIIAFVALLVFQSQG